MWSPVTKNILISSVEPTDKPKFELQDPYHYSEKENTNE